MGNTMGGLATTTLLGCSRWFMHWPRIGVPHPTRKSIAILLAPRQLDTQYLKRDLLRGAVWDK